MLADDKQLGAPARVPNGGLAAWTRVLAYAVCCMGTNGVSYCYGVIYVQFREDMTEPFAGAAALVGSLSLTTMLVFAPLTSVMIGRLGAARTCAIGAVLSGAGIATTAVATSMWHLLGTWSFVLGLGQSMAFVAPTILVTHWFDTRLARAQALAGAASGLATLILGPLLHSLFDSIGWRRALLWLAAVDTVMLGGASLVLTPPPRPAIASAGSTSLTSTLSASTTEHGHHTRLRTVAREPVVMWLGGCTFAYGLGTWVAIVHVIRLSTERGLEPSEASSLLFLIGMGNALLRLPVGFAADRYGRQACFGVGTGLYALLHLLCATPSAGMEAGMEAGIVAGMETGTSEAGTLPAGFSSSHAWLSIYAFCSGGLTAGCNLITNSLALEVLPIAQGRVAIALLYVPFGVGVMIGPLAAAALRDSTGNYTSALLSTAAALAMASAGTFALCCTRARAAHRRPHGRSRRPLPVRCVERMEVEVEVGTTSGDSASLDQTATAALDHAPLRPVPPQRTR